jgi:hypothetical protein
MRKVYGGNGCKAPGKVNVVSKCKSEVNLELLVFTLKKQPAVIWVTG